MKSKAEMKKDLILHAAKEFIRSNDFHALTLDGVASQAGISKGGLLYHFPTKDALVHGLAEHIFNEFVEKFEEHASQDKIERGKWSRALINAYIWDLQHNQGELNIGIIATASLSAEGSNVLSATYQKAINKLDDDGIDQTTANIIRLTLDGMYYSNLFNIAPIDESMRIKVCQELLHLTK